MSSSEDEVRGKPDLFTSKRSKVASRACDRCRRRKIKCDALDRSDLRCTPCSNTKQVCVFSQHSEKCGPPKAYIRDLEKRCAELERLFSRHAPHVNISAEIGPSFTNQETWYAIKTSRLDHPAPAALSQGPSAPSPSTALPPSPTLDPAFYPSNRFGLPVEATQVEDDLDLSPPYMSDTDDEERKQADSYVMKPLERQMAQLNINGFAKRFHGKSSGVHLVQAAMNLREPREDGTAPQLSANFVRNRYWTPEPWEWQIAQPNPAKWRYPADDLAETLVDLAFKKVFALLPLVHRPTFDTQRKSSLHLKNVSFARVYLLVCALGARYCDDERVCYKGVDGKALWGSAGWLYFSQVLNMRCKPIGPFLAAATQSDLQVMTMISVYLQSSSLAHASWLVSGIALRSAVDIGLHRERTYRSESAFNAQMWRRNFWCLVGLDRITSLGSSGSSVHTTFSVDDTIAYGRLSMIEDEEIDAEYPLEVDDEHYDESGKAWRQPEGKPAIMTAFIHYLKLMSILSRSLRSFFSMNKSKIYHGYLGDEWESRVVTELDSDLNSWLNTLPDRLKWDPKMQDDMAFHQAGYLRLLYYWVQTTIHRPFIPTLSPEGKVSALSLPSLAICLNATRAASHVAEAYGNRGFMEGPTISAAFMSALMLLICMQTVKRGGRPTDLGRATEDLQRFTTFLHGIEEKWYLAGRFHDLLKALAKMHYIFLPDLDEPLDRNLQDGSAVNSADSDNQTLFGALSTPQPNIQLGQQVQLPNQNFSPYPLTSFASAPALDAATRYPQQDPGYDFTTGRYPAFGAEPAFYSLPPGTTGSGFSGQPSNAFEEFLGLFGSDQSPVFTDTQFPDLFGSQSADEWNWFNQMVTGDSMLWSQQPPP